LQQNVSGNVTDQSGNPLQGVTVAEKGTTRHTITDDRGNFVLPRSEGRMVLVFSMLGFNTIEREIGNQTTVNCILTESISDLDEVVVVGYGTQKKSDITGTVASIPKERLDMVPNLNIAQAIQGAIPGIQIQQTASGASPNESIIIRGRNSIQAS